MYSTGLARLLACVYFVVYDAKVIYSAKRKRTCVSTDSCFAAVTVANKTGHPATGLRFSMLKVTTHAEA